MPLVRITPENAVETVRQQLDAFIESVGNAGRSPAVLKLGEHARELERLAAGGCLEVELLGLGKLHPAWTGTIAQWLGIEPTSVAGIDDEATTIDLDSDPSQTVRVVRVGSRLDAPPKRAGARTPPILVVARGSKEAPAKETLDQALALIRARPLTLLLAPKDAEWAKAVAGLGSRGSFVCKVLELDGLSSMTLAENMDRPPWKQAGPLAAAWSIAGALSSLYEAFAVALEKEDRATRAKKTAVEVRSQQMQGTPMPTEILGEVRGIVQKQFDRFQKNLSRRLKDQVTPQEGDLWREIDAAVDELDRFDMVKKPKVDAVTIPAEFQAPLLDRIREVLGGLCRSSLVEMHDFLRDVKDQVERLLEERGGPPVVLPFQHLPADRVDTVLQRSVVIQRPYKGEITRKGVMDFFMAARRYQMLFFMVFSAFGLSFIRSFTAFTIPAGMVLMAYGMLNVVNGAKKQRAEAEEKEMDKARDSLRSELSRAMADVQKSWDQTVSTFMTEQQNAALELIETAVRTSSAQSSREAAGAKELVQQQIKSLDATQRKLADGMKKAEAAGQELEQIRASLIEFYVGAANPQEAAAGAPGAAAARAAGAGVAVPKAPDLPPAAAAALEKLKQHGQGDAAKAGAAGGASGAGGGAADRVAALKAKAQERLAKLRGGGGGARSDGAKAGAAGAAKSGGAKAAGAKSGAPGRSPKAGSGSSKADPAKAKQAAQERLEALKAKAKAPASGKAASEKDRP